MITTRRHKLLSSLILGLGVAGTAAAQNDSEIFVTQDITTSTTWTANNTYNLQRQIYVNPGATLTIEAGTIVASTTNLGGSLAVAKGGQIIIQGTQWNPVIMTSKADVQTWTNGDPQTGTWREAANEWGNLTLMGDAFVSEDATVGNSPVPSASNYASMEGLIAAFPGDTRQRYGGGNDDDDSGSISYLSIRYGGKVIALNNELNGLSLGGIGRETDIHHVEIMNNVDDGIEIWGGTVNLKCISIWNVGDDSFDVDQGWRGRAQHGLIVQGYSLDASQGSGVGDNGFETDGAEDSHWQPVTTAVIENFTFIGQPVDGDGATAWRDNARVQYHRCIFMDCGEKLVRFDNIDGDGANGYGWQGTLSWAQTWTTPYTATSTVNAPANPAAFYRSQTSGKLAEILDSVFYNNNNSAAYTEADARGVFASGNNNVRQAGNMPIESITRGAPVNKGGKVMVPVTQLDPRPAHDALVSAARTPEGEFFDSVNYRGGFAPGNSWLEGWTASDAFGFTPGNGWVDLKNSMTGSNGDPVLSGGGNQPGSPAVTLTMRDARANAPAVLVVGFLPGYTPLFGGVMVPNLPTSVTIGFPTSGTGGLSVNLPSGIPTGVTVFLQAWIADPAGPQNFSATNAIKTTGV